MSCSKSKASIYKSRTTIITEEFILSKHERNVQLLNVPATKLTILANFLRTNLPKKALVVADNDMMELSKKLEMTENCVPLLKMLTTKD
uniref:Uncharacterized protein n=1 Tax=Romanomermis culicivorax TaxID=13658 RepID=A0A915JLP6_ROMCU